MPDSMLSCSLPTKVRWVENDLEPVPRRAREAETRGADVRVRRGSERRRAAAEELRLRLQLDVHLEADDGFPTGRNQAHDAYSVGHRLWKSVTC